ncbi:membrane protein insertase YidC [Buchnera aphidicola]|uniref:Preprotein translocase, membrane component n=1 Tax=Buchnera aphidicola subsp. Cinara cedri (strain Cc) TaxID=372461 RepID=Q058F6_BUCCC|nr:membrane protein insertase YidC [Buchnera aphidicola]ABJ90493.1 preprotein translocase, membrane component [Buchnera aphidicola BCc]
MLQKYFFTTRILKYLKLYTFYSHQLNDFFSSFNFISKLSYFKSYILYNIFSNFLCKLEMQINLSKISDNLSLINRYGKLHIIAYPLFHLLNFFYKFFNNWGIAIIFVTILIKIIIYPLTKLQYTSVLQMKLLQPKIDILKNKYADNKDKMNKKILELYSSKKFNPFNSFFSFLIQTPIFLAFYSVLSSSVELKNAPFFLWIKDLSSYDPYHVLPLLMGISILLTQISEIDDKTTRKRKFLSFFSVFFAAFFLWFPSGLILYYITSNIVTLIQHWFIRIQFFKKNT